MASRPGRDLRLLLACLAASLAPGSHADPPLHANGLIYDSATLASLRIIADSVATAYRSCPTPRRCLARPQAIGHFVRFRTDAEEIRKDLASGLPYADLVKRHASSIEARSENLSLTEDEYGRDPGSRQVGYYFFDAEGRYDRHAFAHGSEGRRAGKEVEGTWLFEKRGWRPQHLEALWFASDLRQRALPDAYADMVGYADCMIDTHTVIHPDIPEPLWWTSRHSRLFGAPNDIAGFGTLRLWIRYPRIRKFLDRVEMPRMRYPDTGTIETDEFLAFSRRWDWYHARLAEHRDRIARQPDFPGILEAAVSEGLEHGVSGETLEHFCARHLSKRKALALKRSRRILGRCSLDDSPRLHAQGIAKLSAETGTWDVFLRAHLDIMNDNFARISDGSWAWGGRKTYLRELEGLGLDLPSLLFGIALDFHAPARNHYQGDIGRLGRALAEAAERESLLERMADMIRDESLDDHNRILMFFFYLSTVRHLEDGERKAIGALELHETVSDLPAPLGPSLRGYLGRAGI